MNGSKMTSMTTDEMRAARERSESQSDWNRVRANSPYLWNGQDEDERPLNAEEMQAGLTAFRKKVGRPLGSGNKEQVAIRLDREVLEAFRARGPGWQTRINAALREWLGSHPAG